MPRSFEEWNKEYEQYGGARRQTSAPSSNASPFGQILKPQFMVDPNSRANFVPRSTTPAPIQHPYVDYMTQWNAVKGEAASLGLTNSYGLPTDQYYAMKGKPDWMIQADAAARQRTMAENPSAPAKIRPTAVYDDVAADKREAIANRDYARYAQMMQNMPALEQWFGQFANDYTASYYKDQQQQYQPAAEKKPVPASLTIGGLRQYEQGKNTVFVNPLDTIKGEYEKGMSTIRADAVRSRTPEEIQKIAESYGFANADEMLLSPQSTFIIADLEAKGYQDRSFNESMLGYNYLSGAQKLNDARNAKRFGYDQTLSEKVRQDYQMEQSVPGYQSDYTKSRNPAVMVPQGEFSKSAIQAEIDHWQGVYDGLMKQEGQYKNNTEWQYQRDVALRNLNTAKGQLEFFKPGFQENVAAGSALPGNQVTGADRINAGLNQMFGTDKQGLDAVGFALKNPGAALVGHFASGDIAKSIPTLAYAMYPSEKAIYSAKLAEDPTGASAKAYFESIRASVEHRDYLYTQQENAGKGNLENFISDTLGLPFASSQAWTASIIALAHGENITKNDPRYRPLQEIEQRRGEITKYISDNYPALAPLANAGISMADMGVALLYGGGVNGMSFIMAGEAGSSTIMGTLENGGDIKTAVTRGLIASAVEYFTERLGTGERFTSLFTNPKTARAFWGDFLKSMAAEGVEEIPGWIVNGWTDEMMGPLSEAARRFTALVDSYKGQYGLEKATEMARSQFANENFTQLLDQMLAAGLAGGFGGGFANVAGQINVNSTARSIQNQNPGMEPGLAKALAEAQTGWAPVTPELVQKVEQSIKDSTPPGMQAIDSAEEAAAQPYAPIRPTSEVQEDTARDMQDVPETLQKAPVRPTSEVQEDTPRDINPFVVSAKMDGQDVTISGMESVGQNATVKTDDGKTISFEQLEITDIGMSSLYNMARAFNDKDAANTFLGMFDGKIGAPAYIRAYTQYYTEGIRGTGTDALDKTATGQMLSPMARDAAYQTGQQVRIGLSEKAWGNFPVQAEKGYTGLVKAYTSKVSTDNQNKLTLIDRSAKKFGMQVIVVDTLRYANGMYGGGNKIYVAMDAIDGGITKAASHEFLHYARQQDEGAYNQLKDLVLQAVGDSNVIAQRIQAEIDRHAAAGIKLTSDAALEEIVAQALPDVILNEQTAAQFANENPTLFQKIVQWLREFVAKWKESFAGSPEAEALAKNGKAYQDALALFEKTMNGARPDISVQLDNVDWNTMLFIGKDGKTISVDLSHEEYVTVKGFRGKYSTVSQAVEDGNIRVKPNVGLEILYPPTEQQYKTIEKYIDNFDAKDFYVDVPGDSLQYIDVYDVKKSRIINDIRNVFQTSAPTSANAGVSYSLKSTDSEGNPLSPQQQEFFKDSKVRDENGALMPVYHGTNSDNSFNMFDIGRSRYGLFGIGAYFTESKDIAQQYSKKGRGNNPRIYETYLNIKNPLDMDAPADVVSWKKAFSAFEFPITLQDGITNEQAFRALEEYLIDEEYIKWEGEETVRELVERMGYDGLTHMGGGRVNAEGPRHRVWISFEANQIKNTTNANPTENNYDIRFSLKSTIPSDADAQIAEISELRAAISDIKAQLDITEGAQISGTAVNNLAGKIIRGTGSKYSAVALSDNLGTLFRYLRGKSPDYNDAIAATSDVAKAVLMNAPQGEMNLDDASMALALDIYQQYFELPEIKTVADKAADKLEEVRTRYANRILDIRRQYNERAKEKLSDLREQYAERDARKEETTTRNGYINQIKRIAGELSTRLLSNTDKSNIPEGMKKAVLTLLQSLDFATEKTGERLSTKFALLQNEYQKLRDGGLNSETTLAGVYDEDVNDMLETLVEITSNKSVSDLETEELELVRNVVRMIQHMVATENKLFAQARKETVTDMGQKSIQWLYQQKSKKEWGKVTRIIQTMLTENTLNAETFFAQFEGTPIHELYVSLRDGLDTHILNNKQTEDYLAKAMKEYGYKEWYKTKNVLETESGGTLELTVDEMLTLYATFKREGLTKTDHILGGGVTIKDAQNRIPAKLTKGDMDKLSGMLTDQQRAYADHMVNYLSTVGAEWGNEVSMKLNGFKKFNEKYYIPFRTNEDYNKKAPGQMGDIRLKAGSFTKSLTKRANTPIVIEPFTQLWAQHAEQMSMYNAFALPIEDMTRVWNYRDAEDRASSVKNAISSAFTRTGNDYIRNFLTDLNGGAITPVGQGLFDKLISITKRGSVSANLSVAIQQMSAGVRAMAEIDPKYFIPGSVKGVRYRRSYAELLKWSPTAQLKQWGYFDTSMTRTIYERAKGGFMQWIQDKASWAAQQGDMLNWAQIWEAVKLETKANTDLQGDALLEASARRFRDVVDRTQVVDSIFHRTEWARSKSGLVKLATAFKSEPMMMYNMLFRAKMAAANGNKGRAARYIGGVVSSMILNAALASIIAGFRDRKNEKKDEKGNIIGVRAYEDKYVDAFVDKLVDAPMSIIPILSDAYSMWQGYSADRLDMQPLEKFVNAAKAIVDGDKTWAQKFPKVVDFISMATGIPAFNVYRDTNALYQGVYELINKNTLKGAAYDVTLPIAVRLQAAIANDPIKKPGRQSLNTGIYYDMLTMAKMQGMESDVAAIKAELMRNGISESSIDSTIKERIRQAEPLVRDAAKLLLSGKVSEYSATVGKIEAAGYDREMAVEMAKAEATYIENAARKYMGMDDGESKDAYLKDMEKRGYSKAYLEQVYASLPEKEAGEDAAETLYRYSTLTNALESGNDHDIKMVLDQFVSEGKSMSTIRAQVTKEFKPIYYAAHLRGDTATMKRIETTLTKYLPYKNDRKENDFKEWLSDSYYSDLYTLIDNGDATSAARLRKDMADKQIDSLGDIRDRLKTYYSARYKELLAYNKAAAAKLKATLVSLSFSPEMIDNWARKRN